jgi:hypothetical protein
VIKISETLINKRVQFYSASPNYRSALRLTEPDRILYLAIPVDVYNEFFSRKFIQRIIGEYQLKLPVFNPYQEEIVIWRD